MDSGLIWDGHNWVERMTRAVYSYQGKHSGQAACECAYLPEKVKSEKGNLIKTV